MRIPDVCIFCRQKIKIVDINKFAIFFFFISIIFPVMKIFTTNNDNGEIYPRSKQYLLIFM